LNESPNLVIGAEAGPQEKEAMRGSIMGKLVQVNALMYITTMCVFVCMENNVEANKLCGS